MSQLKRYLVFGGLEYYPSGGIDDFAGSFDSADEARNKVEALVADTSWGRKWAHMYDSVTTMIYRREPEGWSVSIGVAQ